MCTEIGILQIIELIDQEYKAGVKRGKLKLGENWVQSKVFGKNFLDTADLVYQSGLEKASRDGLDGVPQESLQKKFGYGAEERSTQGYGRKKKALKDWMMLNWISKNTNWIQLEVNWYMTLSNLSKLSRISSASDSPIHVAERMEADLFGTKDLGETLPGLTTQPAMFTENPG